jgi:hypothetical protein
MAKMTKIEQNNRNTLIAKIVSDAKVARREGPCADPEATYALHLIEKHGLTALLDETGQQVPEVIPAC